MPSVPEILKGVGVFVLGVQIDYVLMAGVAVLVGAAWSGGMTARRSVRAEPREHRLALPGDELIAAPVGTLTHAITIHRGAADVWPWLAQMGAGSRAGWYSYDWIDNGRRASASRIVPELQQLQAGMIFPALPGVNDGFTLLAFAPESFLLLGWLAPDRSPTVTWAFVLEPHGPGVTRLIVRVRAARGYRFHGLPAWASKYLASAVHFVMQRRQLLGIADRAAGTSEAAARGHRAAVHAA